MNRALIEYLGVMFFLIASAAAFSGRSDFSLGFLSIGFFIIGMVNVFHD